MICVGQVLAIARQQVIDRMECRDPDVGGSWRQRAAPAAGYAAVQESDRQGRGVPRVRTPHLLNSKLVIRPNGTSRLLLRWRDASINRCTAASRRCSLVAVITLLLLAWTMI